MVGEVKIFNKNIINVKDKRKPVDENSRKRNRLFQQQVPLLKIGEKLLIGSFSFGDKGRDHSNRTERLRTAVRIISKNF